MIVILMAMLMALYVLNSLFSTLLTLGHYMVWFCDTLKSLGPVKLAQEAWQRRFEDSVEGIRRYRFYLLVVKRLTEVRCGALIYFRSRFLVLLAINMFQQRAEGDWLWILVVSPNWMARGRGRAALRVLAMRLPRLASVAAK